MRLRIIDNKLSLISRLICVGIAITILLYVRAYAEPQQKSFDKSLPTKNKQAEELVATGITLERAGKIDQAITIYEKVIREFPNATYEDEIGKGKYSEDARIRLNALHCLKARGHDFTAESRDALVNSLKEAFQGKNSDKLVQYAACDFKVGKPETDAVWQLLPDQVAPVLSDLVETLDWSSASFDPSGYLNLKKKAGAGEHVFALEQKSNGWKWVGYFTTDKNTLDHLWKMRQK